MSDQINKDGSINHRPDLDQLPRTADEWNDETVLLRRQLTAAQARVKELEQDLQDISTNLCGMKVEGEVTFDMVYCFVEAQIDKQSERAAKAEQLVCDFQAAAMIDVGDQGPCRVEPRHVEKHVTDLRERIATLEQGNAALEISHQLELAQQTNQRLVELEQERAAIIQALTVEYNDPNDKLSGDVIEDLACFITHHKKKEQRIATLEQALKASNNQILELINGAASLLAHMPDAPLLSDGGTAQSFLRVQIALAKEVINGNLKTIGKAS